jgi:hypothetical protein
VPRNSVCGNTTYYIRIFCVVIHLYCYNVCSMHIHPNAIHNYIAIKDIATILAIATIIDHNISLCGNNHNYCNNIKAIAECYCNATTCTTFNQSHIIAIWRYCNKYDPIVTIFHHGNRLIF